MQNIFCDRGANAQWSAQWSLMIQNHAISKYPAGFGPEIAHCAFTLSKMMSLNTPFPLSKILQKLMTFFPKKRQKKIQDFFQKNFIFGKISTLGTQNDNQYHYGQCENTVGHLLAKTSRIENC